VATLADIAGMPGVVRKTVLIFDICSSTAILENLIRTENVVRWERVLGELKRYMWQLNDAVEFATYKFLGDGWILLFDDGSLHKDALLLLMRAIELKYERLFKAEIEPVLTSMPEIVGITFGIDEGSLARLTINKKEEYVGRAINVAARLQSAVKSLGGPPNGIALFSANAFARLGITAKSDGVECSLPNVVGGTSYRARCVRLKDVVVTE
jgi:class 3 adenylate cyclase